MLTTDQPARVLEAEHCLRVTTTGVFGLKVHHQPMLMVGHTELNMSNTANEVAKLTPPILTGGLTLLSIPLHDWVLILTIVYTCILIVDKIFPRFVQRTAKLVLNKLQGL